MNPESHEKKRPHNKADFIFLILFVSVGTLLILSLILFHFLPVASALSDAVSALCCGLLLFGIPLVTTAWFATSLVLFCRTPRGAELRRMRRHSLVRASVLFCMVTSVYITFDIMLSLAIRNM